MVAKPEPEFVICASVSGELYEEYKVVEVRRAGDQFECVLEDATGARRTVMASKVERKN